MAIELKNVVKTYPARQSTDSSVVRALDGVTLHVPKGEWLAVMGPSGSGKSTLVNLIGCLDRADSGKIILHGQDVAALSSSELTRFRAEKIGFVFQQFHLIPYLTALENVMLAQYFHSMTDEQEANAALERVGLADRANHLPSQLSGGEQQRVCIARALINDPKIILADEPTGNLDAYNQELVLTQLRDLHAQGCTIIMVTHDPVISRMADRRVEIHHGRLTVQETYGIADEQQIDEVLEEIWILRENGEPAEVGRMNVEGSMPMPLALSSMEKMGLITRHEHSAAEPHTHKPVLNRCHEQIHTTADSPEHGPELIYFTERGRQRAEDVIRRHRLAERLFIQNFKVTDG